MDVVQMLGHDDFRRWHINDIIVCFRWKISVVRVTLLATDNVRLPERVYSFPSVPYSEP